MRTLLLMTAAWLALRLAAAAQEVATPAQLDSLRGVLKAAQADTARVRLLVRLSQAYLPSDSAQAWAYAKRALALAQSHESPQLLPDVYNALEKVLFTQNRMSEALHYTQKAIDLSRQLGARAPLARNYYSLGRIYSKLYLKNNLVMSRNAFQAALTLQQQLHDTLGMVKTYSDIGTAYEQEGRYPLALQVSLKALRLSEGHTGASYMPARIRLLRNLSAAFSQQGDTVQELHYLRQAHLLLQRHFYPVLEVGVLIDLGAHYLDAQRDALALHYYRAAERQWERHGVQTPRREPADIAQGLGLLALRRRDYAHALPQLRRAAAAFKELGKTTSYIDVLHNLAETQQQQRRYEAATATAKHALAVAQRAGYAGKVASGYAMLARVRAAAGDSAAALRYQLQYQALHDTLFSQQNARQMAELRTRYETEKQQAQILGLRRAVAWERHGLAWQRRARNLLVGGLAVAALLGGAVYWRYRRERRARRQLQAKEQELERTQQRLRHSLAEKEVLLKEIHHRVKNNLQVIASRLALQALEQPGNSGVRAALRDGQNWVKTIALIHEMLYQSEDLASVECQSFLERLVVQLGRAFAGAENAGPVTCEVHAPRVQVSTATAVPLGLIVNELLSNSYKHAFRDGRAGHVRIQIEVDETRGGYSLSIRDDGAGLPPNFSLEKVSSLGLSLVKDLARQLEGSFAAERLEVGAQFLVSFHEVDELLQAA